MRGSAFDLESGKRWLLAAICVGGTLLSAASQADHRHRGDDGWRHRGNERFERRWDHRSQWRRDHRSYRDTRRHYQPDWHYHSGRYWAPPRYRGRYCNDGRHFHGVHYHVAARDYYDYYYPRYRSYGSRPFSADANLIITVPLF
jgi:hypothetical protein